MQLFRRCKVFAAAALTGCSLLDEPELMELSVIASISPFELSLGDTARVTIDILNVSNQTISVSSGGCNNDFVIQSGTGATYVPAELVVCSLELRAPTVLVPGGTHRLVEFTTGRVIPQGSQAAPAMLQPDTYGVRAVVGMIRGNNAAVEVRSQPAGLTFLAR